MNTSYSAPSSRFVAWEATWPLRETGDGSPPIIKFEPTWGWPFTPLHRSLIFRIRIRLSLKKTSPDRFLQISGAPRPNGKNKEGLVMNGGP